MICKTHLKKELKQSLDKYLKEWDEIECVKQKWDKQELDKQKWYKKEWNKQNWVLTWEWK